eukprot:TRINITY_DN67_c0_g1_i1.p1 TRINITY_DN67_c0_g1~~TRINITY_DN67_c0_g1_i1.p1  ORF type:complete len:270 (-),score=55.17 TRINITY_DN67_c0_g1_i1:153-962(-)
MSHRGDVTSRGRKPLLAGLMCAGAAFFFTATSGKLSFVASPSLGLAPVSPASHVALRAAEVVDAEMAEEPAATAEAETAVQSVFDGPKNPSRTVRYRGWRYKVFQDGTYKHLAWATRVAKGAARNESATGQWNALLDMPEVEFQRRKPRMIRQYNALKRKMRIKHGMGQKYPNGREIYMVRLKDNPMTTYLHGDKYSKPAEWHFSPKEIESRERQLRAQALKRRLEQEAEETRIARMKELNVWLGDEGWRRPWQAKAPYQNKDARRQGR